MTLPNLKPTANTSKSERHHFDPPGLWATVILSSFVIHLFVFGMLRLWLTLRFDNVLATQNFIPIDVIAVASEAKPPTQPSQTNASAANQNPSLANNSAKAPNQFPNNQSSSKSARTDSPQTGTQEGVKREGTKATGNQSPPAQTIPTVKESPTTTPSQNPSPETSVQKPSPSPAPNPSPNNPSETQAPSTKPNSPSNPGNQSNGSTTSPSPSPSSPGSGDDQNSSAPQSGGIFISSTNQPELISNNNEVLYPNDPSSGDALATLLQGSTRLSGDELKQLGITVEREFEMKVVVLIDEKGSASLQRVIPQGLPDNLSLDSVEQLASKGVAKLKFIPTKMAGGDVPRYYNLTLRIRPNQN